jgi:GntR family transcriptional regulator/MocR family aminotransferase
LDLTARLTLDPGDRVLVEDPCHPIVVSMLKAFGAVVVPVPVDRHGMDPGAAQPDSGGARLIYVTPAHQFPLGVTMSAERRLALLALARRNAAVIFEDDYDSEYRYRGRPIPALQGLDGGGGAVVFAGSFSKVLLPSLRLGYLVVPPELVDKFAAARFASDRHSSIIDQAAMCDFISEGHFGRHIRRMRELYGSRLAVLRDRVGQRLCGALELAETESGLHTAGWLGSSLKAEAAAREGIAHKLELFPISGFTLKWARPEGLLMGFAGIDAQEIRRGVDRLATVLDGLRQNE